MLYFLQYNVFENSVLMSDFLSTRENVNVYIYFRFSCNVFNFALVYIRTTSNINIIYGKIYSQNVKESMYH